MQPSVSKVRKGMIPLVFLGHGQTTNADHYITMLTKLKAPTCRVRTAKTTFLLHHSNVRPHTSLKTVKTLPILAALSYHIHRTVWIWCLLTFTCWDQ